jgi:nucleoside-diphosphate-sugar epimerase
MLGRALLRQFSRRTDLAVTALYRRAPDVSVENITSAIIDPNDRKKVTALLQEVRPSFFVHAAAGGMQTPRPDTTTLKQANVHLPLQLIEAVKELGTCRFVHVSTGLAYKDQGRLLREDDPLESAHPYGASKAEADDALRRFASVNDVALTIVRPFSFTGVGDFGTRLFPSLLQSAVEQKPFEMSAGDQVRDHASVDDIAAGIISSLKAEPGIFNLGAGDTRTLRELVSSIVHELGLEIELRFGVRPYAPGEAMFLVPDLNRARQELNCSARENVAHAVWRLAQESFPLLKVKEPAQMR